MKKIILIYTLFFLPVFCVAETSFVISEIMLNPEGSDSDREWIEVTNLGAGTGVDGFKFKEGSTSTSAVSHGLKIPDGGNPSWLIGANQSFVIVSDPEKFYLDYPDYSQKIFDSSFSLTNSGEYLSILDLNKNILFEINVTAEMIPEEGQTICLLDDIWKKCNPNPGRDAVQTDVVSGIVTGGGEDEEPAPSAPAKENPDQNPNQGPDQPVVQQTYIEIKNPDYREKVIKADGGGDRIILAGSEFLFEAKSYGLLGNPLRDPKYRWNFGDGKTETGQKALHVYHHPGEYTATLSAKTERHINVDRFKIKVIEPDLKITEVSEKDGYIKIKNQTRHDLDISFFYLVYENTRFEIPEDTFIESGGELIFPKEYTEIEAEGEYRIKLQTPNKKNIDVFEYEEPERQEAAAQVSQTQKTVPIPMPVVETQQALPRNSETKTESKNETIIKEQTETKVSDPGDKDAFEEGSGQAAQVLVNPKNDSIKISAYLYEIIFALLVGSLIIAALFVKPKEANTKEAKEKKEIEKEAKKYEINER